MQAPQEIMDRSSYMPCRKVGEPAPNKSDFYKTLIEE